MSGGSWEYFYIQLNECAGELSRQQCPLRVALGKKMELMAEAMHDIEWVDSGDYGDGDDEKAILDVITEADVTDVLIERAKSIHDQLERYLK